MKYGLIGEHLVHSFSKQIQTRIAEIENVKDYDYQLVELNKEEFKEFMEKKDFKGINVTIPYKKMSFHIWMKWMKVPRPLVLSTQLSMWMVN